MSIVSANANPALAKVGDTVTVSFTANENLQTPSVTIAGHAATVSGANDTWSATWVMAGGDSEGLVAFSIGFSDQAGNAGTAVSATTDASSVTFDKSAPSLSSVSIVSANANPALAKVGDTVTVSFTANENLQTPSVTIAGHAATVSGANDTWSATWVMAGGDSEGLVAFSIGFSDQAGNAGTAVSATTDASSVTFDKSAPTVMINQAGTQPDPTTSSTIHFTAVFSEPVSNFIGTDVTITGTAGGTKTAVVSEIAPNDGTTYDVAVSGMATIGGTVVAAIPAGGNSPSSVGAQDAAGNGNTASSSTDNTVTWQVLVSGGGSTNAIQAAIDAASSGDTINISGVFTCGSGIVINKTIKLQEGPGPSAKLTGTAGCPIIITINSGGNGSTIEGIDIDPASIGIKVAASNVTIKNTKIYGMTDAGIQVFSGTNNKIQKNLIDGQNTGLSTQDGIRIEAAAGNTSVQENDTYRNKRNGIRVLSSGNSLMKNEAVPAGQGGNGADGIYVKGNNNTLQENEAYGNAGTGNGIYVEGNTNTLKKNKAGDPEHDGAGNNGDGIYVKGNNNAIKENVTNQNHRHGVEVLGNSNDLRKGDSGAQSIGNTLDGFNIQGYGNQIEENEAYANGGNGFLVAGSTASSPNTLKKNKAGAANGGNGLDGFNVAGTGTVLTENDALNNGRNGIGIAGASSSVTKNDAISNGQDGFKVAGTKNTLEENTANRNGVALGSAGCTASNVGGDGFDISGGTSSAPNNLKKNKSNESANGGVDENKSCEYRLAGTVRDQGDNKRDNANFVGTGNPKTYTAGNYE